MPLATAYLNHKSMDLLCHGHDVAVEMYFCLVFNIKIDRTA